MTVRIRYRSILLFALLLSLTASAACSVALKERATLSLEAAYDTAVRAQELEISLYELGTTGLTEEQHRSFHGALVTVFESVERAATALRAWRAGDPTPAGLPEALSASRELVAALQIDEPRVALALEYAQTLVNALQELNDLFD